MGQESHVATRFDQGPPGHYHPRRVTSKALGIHVPLAARQSGGVGVGAVRDSVSARRGEVITDRTKKLQRTLGP